MITRQGYVTTDVQQRNASISDVYGVDRTMGYCRHNVVCLSLCLWHCTLWLNDIHVHPTV